MSKSMEEIIDETYAKDRMNNDPLENASPGEVLKKELSPKPSAKIKKRNDGTASFATEPLRNRRVDRKSYFPGRV